MVPKKLRTTDGVDVYPLPEPVRLIEIGYCPGPIAILEITVKLPPLNEYDGTDVYPDP